MSHQATIARILASTPLVRASVLVSAGVTRAAMLAAVNRGDAVRIVHGVFAGRDAAAHPLIDDAAACLVTGGVICNRSAAVRHALTDDMPDELELLVPRQGAGKPREGFPCRLRHVSNPASLTLGVTTRDVLGLPVRLTDKARTVVDQYRFGVSEQHVLQALHTYLGEGGTGNELQLLADALYPGLWGKLSRDVANVGLARDRAISTEGRDAPDCEQGDDHPGGPAFLRGGP